MNINKNKVVMKSLLRFSLLIQISLIILCCSQTNDRHAPSHPSLNTSIFYDSVFISPFGGYGYDIIMNGRIIIHQPHIPAIESQKGFVTSDDATKIAQVVIEKLSLSQFPNMTRKELKELGIVE